MLRACGFLSPVCAAALLAACAPWAHGPQVSPAASGLVGEWVGPVTPESADTTRWRFTAEGTSEQVRIRRSDEPQRTPFGSFRVYADTGRIQLICFSFRRGRARPGCRYFQVDTPSNAGAIRELRLLNWVGEKQRNPEIWIGRTP